MRAVGSATTADPPDDVHAGTRREVSPAMSLELTGGEVGRDAIAFREVVSRAQGDEIREGCGAALGVGVVMVAVGRRVGATTTEDGDVLALVSGSGEPLGTLGRGEVTLGVFLRGRAPGRRAYEQDRDADNAEGVQ